MKTNSYTGRMIESLIASVEKVQPTPNPTPEPASTDLETQIQEIIEGRLGGDADFWGSLPDAPRRGRAA
jgi:hypothetical protein